MRYSKPFNNQYRYEPGLSGILFHKLSTKNLSTGRELTEK